MPTTNHLQKGSVVARVAELTLVSLRARASYPTRAWTALALPVLLGSLLGWSTRMKLEGLLLGALVTLLYTIACFVWKKYLK